MHEPSVRVAMCVAVLITANIAVASLASAQTGSDAGNYLRAGDEIRITVWQRKELSGEFTVGPDGNVLHPLYKELHVAGEPFPVIEERVRTFLTKFESNPQVVVEPLVRVYVGGQVRAGALMAVPPSTTVAQAVALAGPSEQANLGHVRLIRDGLEIRADLRRPGFGVANEAVRSGDELFVPRSPAILQEYIMPGASLANILITILVFFRR